MAIQYITFNSCTAPGTVTIGGQAKAYDPIYMCVAAHGALLGASMADQNGNFTVVGSITGKFPPGSYDITLTDVPGGSGTWTTPVRATFN
ncbi:hypothetical protein [Pseudomonas brassicacearum]|uniref:hypothetical protein n=1 Tax=Pseudomonas brassicacearum TaxID=930166 RepID=UPI0011CD546F|nr:hypothetical protein [Pseudomonas brassicacearum]